MSPCWTADSQQDSWVEEYKHEGWFKEQFGETKDISSAPHMPDRLQTDQIENSVDRLDWSIFGVDQIGLEAVDIYESVDSSC